MVEIVLYDMTVFYDMFSNGILAISCEENMYEVNSENPEKQGGTSGGGGHLE